MTKSRLVTTDCFECGHPLEGPWCPACNPGGVKAPSQALSRLEGVLGGEEAPDHTVHFKRREDGGLYVWSDTDPGLILAGSDPAHVASCIWPALEALRKHEDGRYIGISTPSQAPASSSADPDGCPWHDRLAKPTETK